MARKKRALDSETADLVDATLGAYRELVALSTPRVRAQAKGRLLPMRAVLTEIYAQWANEWIVRFASLLSLPE